ncbi:MAG TPA: amino acid ABC transporter substrate-binding protein [Terrisporobacter glycolicus]|uniref:Lysine/arginine/ornithine-binding periplasmic protein n=1 Tax=Terrisporobacter petrolearius TaxID=1460447 RepID=A0ABZ3FJ34_9FIRM|nr:MULTISPECIES: amino acid ABC transporter substrate-binding protein [Terrisporobacter]MBN9646644.1 amino acid ABC transporter substrate-binding protein [Terrisporobacter glycolicus]HBI93312.1 amino acid ABC transporter substrate-binding protein [Terrisporobacter hibernicus]
MKKILKKLTMVLAVLVIMIGVVGCNKKNVDLNNNEIVIGYDNTYFPMGYLDDNGKTVGFDVDLATETFKRLNVNVKFQSIDWSMKETELNSGNIDAIWNGYSLTQERKEKVTYTDAYMKNSQLIVTLKDSPIKNKEDLKGKIIGTQQGSAGQEALEKDTKVLKSLDGSPVLYDTFDKVFRDLEAGRINAIVGDETLVKYYISKKGEEKYKILDDNFGTEDYVVAFRKDDTELRDKVNKTIKEIKKDKTFDEIYKKWFGKAD